MKTSNAFARKTEYESLGDFPAPLPVPSFMTELRGMREFDEEKDVYFCRRGAELRPDRVKQCELVFNKTSADKKINWQRVLEKPLPASARPSVSEMWTEILLYVSRNLLNLTDTEDEHYYVSNRRRFNKHIRCAVLKPPKVFRSTAIPARPSRPCEMFEDKTHFFVRHRGKPTKADPVKVIPSKAAVTFVAGPPTAMPKPKPKPARKAK